MTTGCNRFAVGASRLQPDQPTDPIRCANSDSEEQQIYAIQYEFNSGP